MSNTTRYPQCHMRTAMGNCDPIGGFCTSVNESVCEALHKVSRPHGEWIDRSGGIEGAWNYCSVCGEQAIDLYDFCPNCGADMREKEDEYCGTCRFELYCPEMCEGCCEWDSHYEPKDGVKLCRECEEYAGDGMYCASNYLVYDFDTCKDESRTKRSR